MIIDKLLQGAVLGVVQKKIVEKLASNKQFQQMSIQFRDKVEELTGERPPKNINKSNHNNNNNHHHSGASSRNLHNNNNNSSNPFNSQNLKYTNDIHENARIYEQQQKLQRQQKRYEYQEMKNEQQQQQPQNKGFVSHLFDGFKEEFQSEIDRLNGKNKNDKK